MLTSEGANQLIQYLESRGFTPECLETKTRFHYPQRLSRLVTINRTREGTYFVSFSKALDDFADHWKLSSTGELPIEYSEAAALINNTTSHE
jgi:hypothetical protein